MERRRDQLIDHIGERRCTVGDHLDRRPVRGLGGGVEPSRRSDIPLAGHVHIDHLTVLVCGLVYTYRPTPAALTYVSPVNHRSPTKCRRGRPRLGQLGIKALNPPVQREAIHLDAALGEEFRTR